MRIRVLFILALTCGAAVGCRGTAQDDITYQSRMISGATQEGLLSSAELLLRREFPRVTTDRVKRRVVAEPVEFVTTHDSQTTADLVSGRTTMRRRGQVQVAASPEGAVARIRIDIERQDTARQEMLAMNQAPDRGFGDAPSRQTAIDRDAATSRRQNTVWTFVRRDRNLERAILDDLVRQNERAAASEPAATQPK